MAEGIKETKEAVIGAMVIGGLVAQELKDGFQFPGDLANLFTKIMSDPAKKAKLESAVADIQKVPAEIQDITWGEGIELASAVIAELPALVGGQVK